MISIKLIKNRKNNCRVQKRFQKSQCPTSKGPNMITCLKLHCVQAAHYCIRKWALDILSGGHKSAGILPNRAPYHRRFTDPKAKLGGKPSKLCLNMNRNKQGSTVKLAKIKDYGSYIPWPVAAETCGGRPWGSGVYIHSESQRPSLRWPFSWGCWRLPIFF